MRNVGALSPSRSSLGMKRSFVLMVSVRILPIQPPSLAGVNVPMTDIVRTSSACGRRWIGCRAVAPAAGHSDHRGRPNVSEFLLPHLGETAIGIEEALQNVGDEVRHGFRGAIRLLIELGIGMKLPDRK